jgi:hypothetical protein
MRIEDVASNYPRGISVSDLDEECLPRTEVTDKHTDKDE